jgi:hypothetical protein
MNHCTNPRRPSSIVFLLCAFVPLWLFSGCNRVNAVDPNQVRQIAAQIGVMVASVDAYQQATSAEIESMVASGIIDPNKAAKILAGNVHVDNLQEIVTAISSDIENADYSDTTGLLTLIKAAQSANAATAAWNPYAALITGLLALLSALLGLKLKAVALKYQAHKQGVERTMKLASASDVAEVKKFEQVLYDSIGSARSALGVT